MKKVLTVVALFCVACSISQEKEVPTETTEAIKNDVWIPFMEAYRDYDEEKLKSIHSSDIIRVNIDNNQIRTGEAYLQEFAAFLPRMKETGDRVGIAFAILTTAFNESVELVYQTGHYQFQMQGPNEPELTPRGYGFFNVGLRKENGIWKIFLDSDTKVELTEEEFQKAGISYSLSN